MAMILIWYDIQKNDIADLWTRHTMNTRPTLSTLGPIEKYVSLAYMKGLAFVHYWFVRSLNTMLLFRQNTFIFESKVLLMIDWLPFLLSSRIMTQFAQFFVPASFALQVFFAVSKVGSVHKAGAAQQCPPGLSIRVYLVLSGGTAVKTTTTPRKRAVSPAQARLISSSFASVWHAGL
jgi:hypothetical protein